MADNQQVTHSPDTRAIGKHIEDMNYQAKQSSEDVLSNAQTAHLSLFNRIKEIQLEIETVRTEIELLGSNDLKTFRAKLARLKYLDAKAQEFKLYLKNEPNWQYYQV
jgi:hypothetical protein